MQLKLFPVTLQLTTAVLFLFSPLSSNAQPLKVSYPIAYPPNDIKDPITDLHLDFPNFVFPSPGSSAPLDLPDIVLIDKNPPGRETTASLSCEGTSFTGLKCDFTFDPGLFAQAQMIMLKTTLKCDLLSECVNLKESYWTSEKRKEKPGAGPVNPVLPKPEVKIQRNSPLLLTFFNKNLSPITYSDLALYTSLPIEKFSTSAFDTPEVNSPLVWSNTFTLAPGESIAFSFDSLIEPEKTYSLLTGSTFLANNPTDVANFAIASDPTEKPVPCPEPSQFLGLLALGTLGAASTLKRKLKSSKSSEKETTKVS
ncbi:MAG: hypothetical protein RLZZ580_920 [Cyanobacteriota bacterium]|jgi:hypothetical protein